MRNSADRARTSKAGGRRRAFRGAVQPDAPVPDTGGVPPPAGRGYPRAPAGGDVAGRDYGHAEAGRAAGDPDPAGAGWADGSWSSPPAGQPGGGLAAGNLIRGFPPAPGERVPSYTAPFTAWNRDARPADPRTRTGPEAGEYARAGTGDGSRAATISPRDFDTDYSIPAVRDPIPEAGRAADLAGLGQPPGAAGAGRGRHSGSHSAPAGPAPVARPAPATPGQPAATRPGTGRRAGAARGRAPGARLAIGAAALVVVAAGAYLLLGNSAPPTAPSRATQSAHQPSSPAASPSLGHWRYLGARTTDPMPLTMHELFPLSFVSGGQTYTRAIARKSVSCSPALVGTGLQGAARQAGCTQAVRASYFSGRAKVMGTIGVLNLRSYPAAARAGKATGPANYIAQLKAGRGPTHRLGGGTGLEEAVVKGHYLILVWAQYTSLRAPTTHAQQAALQAFMQVLIQQTANVSLSYRMVDGKPSPLG